MQNFPSVYEENKNFKPLLSILVPAYCYAEGLERIMSSLTLFSSNKVEIIIFDDSPNCDIEKIVCKYASKSVSTIKYQHNSPPLGAIDNWNALLDAARGDYCLLMHHDEFPFGDNYIYDLINELSSSSGAAILLLDCLLVNPLSGRYRQHLPMWLRAFVVNNFPSFLFRRNVIGPTSALVISRDLYPRFNRKLSWLVDVDLYFRLFKSEHKLKLCNHIKIGSILNRPDSITANLSHQIKEIRRKECAYLYGFYLNKYIWLNLDRTLARIFIYAFESMVWIAFRLIYFTFNIFTKFNIFKN